MTLIEGNTAKVGATNNGFSGEIHEGMVTMLVSTKGRYALRLMMDVATFGTDGPVSLKDASERQGFSVKYLEQLVRPLANAGLLTSVRGQHGGYTLARPVEEITAGEILRAAEGDVAPIYCLEDGADECPRASICTTLGFWQGLDDLINDYIDSYTLARLLTVDISIEERRA